MTVFALSSGSGRAGVAVVRVSGPLAGESLCRLTSGTLPEARRTVLRTIVDPVDCTPIDRALVVWFPGPRSFTGQDCAEYHVHGGRAVVEKLLRCLGNTQGHRPAEPGEFTRMAFDEGKLDLTEVEGLADLIAAETEAQRRLAFGHFGGEFSRVVQSWRARLIRALAHFEAAIDFADEDLPADTSSSVRSEMVDLEREISGYLDDRRRGEMIRDGCQVVIVGAPNVGKSSLLNCLAARDVAIVSSIAGTTRDSIEVHLDLAGFQVDLVDTAGVRDLSEERSSSAEGAIEAEGMRRSKLRAAQADLKLVVFDASALPDLDQETAGLVDEDSLVVFNKADLCVTSGVPREVSGLAVSLISVETGQGIDAFLDRLSRDVEKRLSDRGASLPITRERHRAALGRCREALVRFASVEAAELAAEDLRIAMRELGRLTGQVDVEDLLDVIFRDFCIGK